MLMSGFYAAVVFADAFHSDFSAMTGIGAPTVFMIVMLLPSLCILLGIWDGYFKHKHDPNA